MFVMLTLLLFACSSFPEPGPEKNSLLVIPWDIRDIAMETGETLFQDYLVLQNLDAPEQILQIVTSSGNKSNYRVIAVTPGNWQVKSRNLASGENNQTVSPPVLLPLEISANMVYLFPYIVTARRYRHDGGRLVGSYMEMRPEVQAAIALDLQDRINFASWTGSSFIGFGSSIPRFSPRLDSYAVSVSSNPGRAEVYINDRKQGQTPLTMELDSGRHYLEVRKEGFSPYRSYLQLDSDTEVQLDLTVLAEDSSMDTQSESQSALSDLGAGIAAPRFSTYRLLIDRFVNLGAETDVYLSDLFRTSLQVVLERDRRLEVLDVTNLSASEGEVGNYSVLPDFSAATELAADLLISGDFFVDGDAVLVRGCLYDVRKVGVKAAVLYQGEAGIEIFDTIDNMTLEFAGAVDRVLPEAGREIITETELVSASIIETERRIGAKELIKRRSLLNTAWQGSAGLGGILLTVVNSDDTLLSAVSGVPFSAELTWLRMMNSNLALSLGGGGHVLFGYEGDISVGGFHIQPTLELSVSGGMIDIFAKAGGLLSYKPSFHIDRHDGDTLERSYFSPLLVFGPVLETGARLYTYTRHSQPARYQTFGSSLAPYVWQYDFLKMDRNAGSFYLNIYYGIGVRI